MKDLPSRDEAIILLYKYVKKDNLRKHMLATEAAMRRLATIFNEDVEKWGLVGLLHDFDYECYPDPADHPMQGSAILKKKATRMTFDKLF